MMNTVNKAAEQCLLAGYKTPADTLTYTTYLLATHSDVQKKLQAKNDQYFEEVAVRLKAERDYVCVTKVQYEPTGGITL